MNALQKILMGLLLAKIKLGGVYTRDWEKDPNPENWRTINGSHVHLVNGKIDGGAGGKFKGNNWTGQKAHGSNSFFPRFNYQQNLFGGQEVMPSRTVQKEQNRQKRIERRAQRRNERHEANKAAGLARQKELASMSIPQLQQQQKEAFLNPSMSTAQAMEEKRALNKIIKRREKADPNLNKNHPYWSTPEGKAQAKADKWFDTLDDPNSSRQTQPREKIIQTQYEAARKKMLSLNSAVAGANNEIDRINRKRGELTKADISRKQQLRKQARQLEMEANAFARRFEQWKKKYNPKEETGIKTRINLGSVKNEKQTSGHVPVGTINRFKGRYKSLSDYDKSVVDQLLKKGKQDPEVYDRIFDGYGNHADIAINVIEALKNRTITPTAARNVMAELFTKRNSVLLNALARDWLWQLDDNNKNISTNKGNGDIIKANKGVVIGAKSEAHRAGVKAAIDRCLSHGMKTGNEQLSFIGHDGKQVLPDITGNKNSVNLSREQDDYLRSLSVNAPRSIDTVHNHPSGSAFSWQDLHTMCRLGCIDSMRVIGHNGVEYCVRIGNGKNLHPSRVESAYMEEKNALQDKYQQMVNNGKDPKEAWIEHSNEVMERLAKKLGWEYERRIPNG